MLHCRRVHYSNMMKTCVFTVMFLLHALYTEGQPQPLVGEPVRVPVKVTTTGACPSEQDRLNIRNEFSRNTSITINCGGTTGWRRVGYLDMTDPSQSCPSGLALKTYSPGLRSCGRATNNTIGGCWSTFYNTGGSPYSSVCGRVRGYQFGVTDVFRSYHYRHQSINGFYVNGVSLTHGGSNSRTHIWAFAAGLSETYTGTNTDFFCRCVTEQAPPPPSFVGNNYFCESGRNTAYTGPHIFYPDDPLWDGQNCVSDCCQFNTPPYFTRTLPAPTSDDIELRICSNSGGTFSDIPIDQVELYVK